MKQIDIDSLRADYHGMSCRVIIGLIELEVTIQHTELKSWKIFYEELKAAVADKIQKDIIT